VEKHLIPSNGSAALTCSGGHNKSARPSEALQFTYHCTQRPLRSDGARLVTEATEKSAGFSRGRSPVIAPWKQNEGWAFEAAIQVCEKIRSQVSPDRSCRYITGSMLRQAEFARLAARFSSSYHGVADVAWVPIATKVN
jgi:hypothetical protein